MWKFSSICKINKHYILGPHNVYNVKCCFHVIKTNAFNFKLSPYKKLVDIFLSIMAFWQPWSRCWYGWTRKRVKYNFSSFDMRVCVAYAPSACAWHKLGKRTRAPQIKDVYTEDYQNWIFQNNYMHHKKASTALFACIYTYTLYSEWMTTSIFPHSFRFALRSGNSWVCNV